MPGLSERLAGFSAALLDPTAATPPGLVGPDGAPSPRRFAVYRNNVVVGLTEALKANFPAVARIVGDTFFLVLARAYVSSAPPLSPVLLGYGGGFPDFIAGFAPATDLPYLADVARLETAWLEAYHAQEAESLGPDALANVAPDEAARLVLDLHPSLRLVRSLYPILTIWAMNTGLKEVGPVDFDGVGDDAFVLRPQAEVIVRSLPPGAFDFIAALAQGRPLGDALAAALIAAPEFDLAANIRQLVSAGAITQMRLCGDPEPVPAKELP